MANKIKIQATSSFEKEFLDRFATLCQTRSSWQVWADFITATSCAIANSADRSGEMHDKREAEYESCIKRLGGVDVPGEMFGIIAMAIEENPEQDFLGNLFMRLELGSHWKGQFFTPYSICQLMAGINSENLENQITEKGWVSVNDCACGAGATLIAMVNEMRKHGVNYQNHALFVAQDIDRITGLMCYIQLSLLGCAGYIAIADSLVNPLAGSVLNPAPTESQEMWITPMFFSDVWHWRRMFNMIGSMK